MPPLISKMTDFQWYKATAELGLMLLRLECYGLPIMQPLVNYSSSGSDLSDSEAVVPPEEDTTGRGDYTFRSAAWSIWESRKHF